MKKYLIICSTDPYHAARDSRFNRPNDYPKFGEDTRFTKSIILESFDNLKDAQKELTNMFIRNNNGGYENWGMNVILTQKKDDAPIMAYPTNPDGTRLFVEDVYTYSIEIVNENDLNDLND